MIFLGIRFGSVSGGHFRSDIEFAQGTAARAVLGRALTCSPMAASHSSHSHSDVEMSDRELAISGSESEAEHEWEWAVAKDPRVDLIFRVPTSEEFTMVAPHWWKNADNGRPLRLNVSGKYCSSQRFSLASEIKAKLYGKKLGSVLFIWVWFDVFVEQLRNEFIYFDFLLNAKSMNLWIRSCC